MGNEFTFIHCADLHLGSRFKGLGTTDRALAESMRRSVMESFGRIVDIALKRHADAMVISGDIFDDSNELPSTRMWFSEQLRRLGIPVFICRGNHDSRTSWDDAIPYPDNVHEFGTEPERFPVGDRAEVVGISYSTPHEQRNLAAMLTGSSDRFTIGCVHCDVDSVSEGYSYASCSVSDLVGKGVDYWALGHIHKRNVVSSNPYIVYPGNIQGRSFKESGQKGAYLVTVASGRVSAIEFIPTQTYIWENPVVDITGRSLTDVVQNLSRLVHGKTVCRITFKGSGPLDRMLRTSPEEVRKAIADSIGAVVSETVVQTSPEIDLESMAGRGDVVSSMIASGRRIEGMPIGEIIDIICRNRNLAQYRDVFEGMTEEDIRSLVTDALKGCIARLEAPE